MVFFFSLIISNLLGVFIGERVRNIVPSGESNVLIFFVFSL